MAVTKKSTESNETAPKARPATKGTTSVVLLVTLTGTRNGEDWPAKGATMSLPAEEAADMVEAGMARLVEKGTRETATAGPAENAVV
mgnify:CR=1 FL=1